ncbi:MAG: hypothetical protein ACJ0P1_03210 [Flavobacteriaceae bacterium]|tara:strand:+ start:223 stop:438 length:216 start_codon:yes stop_codon:yes gene_type:complete
MRKLNYYKVILNKVSFNSKLFFKEYKKAYIVLGETDRKDLKRWVLNKISYIPELNIKRWEINNYDIVGPII